jgi:hypothetical protein
VEELLKHATDIIDNITYLSPDGRTLGGMALDVTEDVMFIQQQTDEYFQRKFDE